MNKIGTDYCGNGCRSFQEKVRSTVGKISWRYIYIYLSMSRVFSTMQDIKKKMGLTKSKSHAG